MNRRKFIAAALAAMASAGLWASCQIETSQTVTQSGSGLIPYQKMGLNVFPRNKTAGTTAEQMADIRSLGVRYIRVNFWFDTFFMAGPGAAPDFSRFDEVVEAANGAGVEILAILGPIPGWLTGAGDWQDVYINRFVVPVVGRYKASVKHWEVWNEPDEDFTILDGTPETYFELLRAASSAIKSVDPSAIVVSAATVNIVSKGAAKFEWMDRLVALGLPGVADVLNIHYYSDLDIELGIGGPSLVATAGMPVWVTETGRAGQDLQEKYFRQNVPYIDRALNPERIYWYCYVLGEGPHVPRTTQSWRDRYSSPGLPDPLLQAGRSRISVLLP